MKFVFYIFVLLGLMVFIYLAGPEPRFDGFDNKPLSFKYPLSELNSYLSARESKFKKLKIANEAQIRWKNSSMKAPCAIVYLHGFSASHAEGAPVHRNVAEQFGCNLYLTRLPGHGIDSNDAFREIEPRDWVEEAKHAVAIGKLIGERVIVMATSTGATLATYLAAADKDISALILFSPNFDLYDQTSHLLNGPWGRVIARIFFNGEYREWEAPEEVQKYWTTRYHLDGLHSLRHLVMKTMTSEVFSQIEQPVFVGYYYRDEDHQDEFVSVKKMHDFIRQISTPKKLQRSYQATNANTHPIASDLWNKRWEDVQDATTSFMEEVLDMKNLCADC
jgi:pimeloyl-ACP methyl ester carboxylesterase